MANLDQPRGFIPVGHLTGGEIRPRAYLLDNESSAIGQGDMLKINPVGRGQVTLGAAGDMYNAIGIAAETKNSTEVADDDYILVWDDPRIIYEVQGYTGVTFDAGMVGETANHVATSYDSTYRVSRQELNGNGGGNEQFYILGKVDRPGNEWGEHVKLLVTWNNHRFLTAATS